MGGLAPKVDPLVDRTFGEFVLHERIGEGGFGAVYRAEQPALEREAVVKVLHARLRTSPSAVERFLREARLASRFDHPYAAHIYAFGVEPDGQVWIAMELVRGTPLDEILAAQGPLALERFVPLLERICEVVHSAHEQGIVHRDLKPANVMVLARAGRLLPKLLDFGIAKALADHDGAGDGGAGGAVDGDVALTQRGAIVGSPKYMAPEQWADAGRADARTDLYALGVLAYECLTGAAPFTGDTIPMMALAHVEQPMPSLGPRFPAALDGVLAKALAKAPGDRYQDALALAAAFRAASGTGATAVALPALDPARRDAALRGTPQPIAEALAAFEAARNPHQARDAITRVARAIARYLGLIALACRSRVVGGDEPPRVAELLRELNRRTLTDVEWLALARDLTRAFAQRRDAYPVPELVDACDDRGILDDVAALAGLRDRELADEAQVIALLEGAIARLDGVLAALAFLEHYPLVVTAGAVGERWMGVRRTVRATTPLRASKVPPRGVPVLLDPDGALLLSLAPLFQVAPPAPGAPPELFLFDGRGARGAKLVALPSGFERHDDAVWDWFRAQLKGSLDESATAVAEERPPYRGLDAFSAEDSASYFGREKVVDAFVNRLLVQPLLAVVGRSGVGKSSFVHAGVVPALVGWRTISLRPGPSPIGALVARLEHARVGADLDVDGDADVDVDTVVDADLDAEPRRRPRPTTPLSSVAELRDAIVTDRQALGALLRADAAAHGPIVLVVDQLEEMFTLCSDADERELFAETLAAAARSPDDPVRVVFTLRDDFLVRTEQIAALRSRVAQGLQLLTMPVADDLLRIVVEPARRVGYELEGELAREMVREVADQPGALALISFTAAKLWDLRDRDFKQLTRAAYRSLGGVGGALARHADITIDALPRDELVLARDAFRHLVTTASSRAVLARRDLRQLLGSSPSADRAIEKLVEARLLVASENEFGDQTIEIVHEALIAHWPRLVEWRRDDAEGARFHEQLRAAAAQWHERGRPKGLLWRGDALAELARWHARRAAPLTDVEAAFAQASEQDAARARRGRRLAVVAVFVGLVAAVIALVVSNARTAEQRHELRETLKRQYEDEGRRLVLAGDPQQGIPLLAKSSELGVHGRAHDFVLAQALRAIGGDVLTIRHDSPITIARFSHDGTRIVTAGTDRAAHVWDAATGRLVLALPHAGTVRDARFARDDATIVTASAGATKLWDAATGRARASIAHDGEYTCALYSPDGAAWASAGEDGVVEVRAVAADTLRFRTHGAGAIRSCAFAPDGKQLAIGDRAGTTRLYDARTGALRRELRDQHDRIRATEFSPDGARLVTASDDGTAIVWDAQSGAKLHVLGHRGGVRSAAFSGDGALVVTASADHTAAVWDARTGVQQLVLDGHSTALWHAGFTRDRRFVVTTAEDATAWLWDLASGYVVARWRGHDDSVRTAEFDRAGARVVTASEDGRAIVWKVEPQERVVWLRGHRAEVTDARFSADGTRVVTAGVDGTARVWDATTGAQLRLMTTPNEVVAAAMLSPDKRRAATIGGAIRVWDVTGTGAPRVLAAVESRGDVEWSPDGRWIVTATDDGWIRCWDADSGAQRFAVRGHGGYGVSGASFAPDGRTFATTGEDRAVRVWDLDGHELASQSLNDTTTTIAYDPSGERVLGVISRGRARIWNAKTGATELELVGRAGRVVDARWSPDGAWAITASTDGSAQIFDATTGALLAIISSRQIVSTASFSSDGRRVLIASTDGSVAIHDLALETPSAVELDRALRCKGRDRGKHDPDC